MNVRGSGGHVFDNKYLLCRSVSINSNFSHVTSPHKEATRGVLPVKYKLKNAGVPPRRL